MKIFKFLYIGVFTLLISTLVISCKDKNSSPLLPSITGSAFDVLVVGDPVIWKDSAGKALFDVLNEDMPGLPQSEPTFNISFIPERDFSGILKPVRNLIMFDVNDKIYTQGKVSYARNRWSKPQAIVKIIAPDQKEFIRIVKEKQTEFVSFLEEAERSRAHAFFARYSNPEGAKIIYDHLGTQVTIPSSLNKYKTGNDFVWLSNGSIDLRQDVIIYRYPYHGPDDFKVENLLQKRDSILKEYIEGPAPGSYMTTEHRFDVTYKEVHTDEGYCVLLRGLWRVEGDLMGGPFVSRTCWDKEHNQIITIEGFVYGPSHKKRNYMRQLESVIYSLKIPE